jgi:hypothetical protein
MHGVAHAGIAPSVYRASSAEYTNVTHVQYWERSQYWEQRSKCT